MVGFGENQEGSNRALTANKCWASPKNLPICLLNLHTDFIKTISLPISIHINYYCLMWLPWNFYFQQTSHYVLNYMSMSTAINVRIKRVIDFTCHRCMSKVPGTPHRLNQTLDMNSAQGDWTNLISSASLVLLTNRRRVHWPSDLSQPVACMVTNAHKVHA